MKKTQNHIRRIRFSEKQLDDYRAYFSDISFHRFVTIAVENEILRKRKEAIDTTF